MKKKNINTIFITLLLLVFLIGFVLGWKSSDKSLNEAQLNFEISQIELKSISERIKFSEIFNEDTCNPELINYMSDKIFETGKELDKLDKSQSSKDRNYELLKIKHNLNQVLLYSSYKGYFEKCNSSENIILFFFNESEDSKKQGFILDKIINENRNIKVISMHYNYTQNLDYFYNYFSLKEVPSLIINYENKLEGFKEKDEIIRYIKE